MKYILSEQYLLRGWQKLPYGIMDAETKEVRFLEKEPYLFLSRCDGRTEIPKPQEEPFRKTVEGFLKDRVIRPAKRTDFLNREQVYRLYPCRYKSRICPGRIR